LSEIINHIRKIESLLPKALYRDKHILKQELIRIKRLMADTQPHNPSYKQADTLPLSPPYEQSKQADTLPLSKQADTLPLSPPYKKKDSRAELENKDKSHEIKDKKLIYLEKKLRASVQKRTQREANLPKITYNEELPIVAKKDEIIKAISENRVVIISGETGSGKTTQIPKFCLAAGRGIDGKIGCTQPRRIAAITVAQRIAEELGEEIGKSVGYKIRFTDQTGENTYIKIMTDGILLAETQGDKYLNEYDTIIVDEAHERSLNIDFVLGILKTLLYKRKNLKLVITSATIDTEKFSKAFDNAPVIEVSGRMYPVDIRYLQDLHGFGNVENTSENDEQTHVELAVRAIERLQQESPYGGDILVFMPTEQDIRETCELLEGRDFTGVNILPLYARLSASEQSRVFSQTRGRKIIVATNVAETSITIPGIKYVIDTGLARISQYLPGTRTTSLPVVPVSRSSADQRKGRCGRVANGICIRLFSEKDYESRSLFTPPEILRSNLAEVILRMIALNLGDIWNFPFIDPPAPRLIKDGFDLLTELGAIRSQETEDRSKKSEERRQNSDASSQQQPAVKKIQLTEKGKLMARMPLDPRLSRMLIEANTEGCVKEIAVIASALSIQDPRERPAEKQGEADQAHAVFNDPTSDFITLLNIWNKYHREVRGKGQEGVASLITPKKFCKNYFISFRRMREWRDIHAQIIEELKESEARNQETEAGSQKSEQPTAKIHRSVLSGFLSNIATKKDKNMFQATKGKEVMIFPGSALFNKAGDWIVAAEMVETSRLFARTVANIDVNWLEELGKDQCKYSYLQPHWERNRGEVVAFEQVTLYGLVIIPQRPVSYGIINPDEASDIFIRSALVDGDMKQPFPFMLHNQNLIDEIQNMEEKIRRRDILTSEENIYQFYKERLDKVYDIRTLKKFIKDKRGDGFLRMKKEDLLLYSPDENELTLYPDKLTLGNNIFPCDYHFDPGKPEDGVTIKIPSTLAPSVPAESLDWLVPGLFREKIIAMIKGLPKEYRKRLVPVTTTVDVILKEMPEMVVGWTKRSVSTNIQPPLATSLSNFIYQRFGVDIPGSAWQSDVLPDHLKMRISVTGFDGKELYSGRDTSVLKSKIANEKLQIGDEFESAKKEWEKTNLTQWDFGDLPDSVTIKGKNGTEWLLFPGLEADEQSVNLRLFLHKDDAHISHKKGVAKLFSILFSKDLKFLKKSLTISKEIKDYTKYFGGISIFEKRLYDRVVEELFCKDIRTEQEFFSYAESVACEIIKTGNEKLKIIISVLKAYHEARTTLYDLETAKKANQTLTDFFKTLRDQLSRLVPENFIELYDNERMSHLERYIRAIMIRVQRGMVNFEKDQAKEKDVRIYTDCLNKFLKSLSPHVSEDKRAAIEEYFWLIEEYKVSLFAQELKTAFPVSSKRLEQKSKEIERMA